MTACLTTALPARDTTRAADGFAFAAGCSKHRMGTAPRPRDPQYRSIHASEEG
jgi:hypothetical protein